MNRANALYRAKAMGDVKAWCAIMGSTFWVYRRRARYPLTLRPHGPNSYILWHPGQSRGLGRTLSAHSIYNNGALRCSRDRQLLRGPGASAPLQVVKISRHRSAYLALLLLGRVAHFPGHWSPDKRDRAGDTDVGDLWRFNAPRYVSRELDTYRARVD